VELSGRMPQWLFGFLTIVLTNNAFSQPILNSGYYYDTTSSGTLVVTAAHDGSEQVQHELYVENPYVKFCGGRAARLHYTVTYQIRSNYKNTPIDIQKVPASAQINCIYAGQPFTLVVKLFGYSQSFQQSISPNNILVTSAQDKVTSTFTKYAPPEKPPPNDELPLYVKSFSIATGAVSNGRRNISIVIYALTPRHSTTKLLN
jgi:hypothetical protein